MKQFKPVLICAAVLIVISIAGFALIKLVPDNQPPSETPGEDSLPGIVITDFSSDEVASVEIISASGESFAVDYTDGTFGKSGAMRNADLRLAYSKSKMSELAECLAGLVALEEAGSGENSLFGFGKPQRKIKILLTSGESVTLLIGNDLPLGDGVYLRRADSDTVYTVGESVSGILLREMSDYRSPQLFEAVADTQLIIEAEYTPFGNKPIKVVRRSEDEIKKDGERTSLDICYKLVSPVSAKADPEMINSEFLDKILAVSALRVVEDHPQDLKKYGLDTPSRLSFKTSTGISATLLIGKGTENGGSYVMAEGVPSVIETENDASFSSLSVSGIAMKLLWFYTSSEVSSFEYKTEDGKKHTLTLATNGQNISGTYDGQVISDSNARNLFLRTVRFALAGEVSSDEKYSSPAITITARLTDGKTSTLSLCRINERRYAAVVDGKAAEFYVPVSEVRELTEAFELLSDGKDIPDMF